MTQRARWLGPVMWWVAAALIVAGCSHSAETSAMLDRADRYVREGKYSDARIAYDSILAADRDNATALEKAGLLHYQLGQLSSAYSRLLTAERLNPKSAPVRLGLGRIALIRGKRDEARQEAATVLQADPQNADALLLFAAAAEDPADVDEAIRRIEKSPADFPKRASSRFVLASLYRRKHDSSSANRIIRDVTGQDTSWLVRTALALLSSAPSSSGVRVSNGKTLSPTGSPADLERLVNLELLMNRRDLAEVALRELASRDSSYMPAWRQLSELTLADTNFTEAAKYLDPLLRHDSTDADTRLLRTMLQRANGNAAGALSESRAVLAAHPWLTPARIELARAWLQQDSLAQAQSQFETVTREAPNYPSAVLELAGSYIRAGNASAAVDILNKLAAVDPNSVATYALLGWAYRANGEPSQASRAFREISRVAPKSAEGPYWIGVGLTAEGRYDDAKAQLEEALKRSPDYAEALAQLAQVDFSQQHPGEAIDRVKKQLQIVPNRWQLWNILGLVSEQAHQDESAREAYLTAIRLDSQVIEPRSHLASLDLRVGHSDEAVNALHDILKVDPKNLPALTLLGSELDRRGVVAGARDAYERILQIDPRRADVANNLAVLLSHTGQDDGRAIQLAELALSIDPKNPHIADTLGWLLCRSTSTDQAKAAPVYVRAASLLAFSASQIPENPVIQFHLGVASQKSGDLEGARRAFGRALKSTADFPEREEAQRALATLK